MNNNSTVSIFMMAYNHEKYVAQALDSVLMQKVDFEYQIVLGEDCSTDNTREIVIKYAELYPKKFKLLLHKTNIGAVNNQNLVLANCTGKYVAMLECDDYWTDPLKLQKQVNFLNRNSEVSATYHNVERLDYNTKKTNFIEHYKENTFLTEHDIIFAGGKSTPTLSAVFRSKFINSAPKWVFNSPIGDIPLVFYLMSQGKLYYFKDVMGVYRENLPGSWTENTKNNNWKKNLTYKVKFTGFIQNYNRFNNFKFSDKLNDLYSSNNIIKHFILNVFAHLYRLKKKILD